MKVKCPQCKRMDFVTTEKYDPDVTPNGSFVKCLLPFEIDWLTLSTTLVSEMACPHCMAQLAPAGRLMVIPDDSIKDFFEPTGPIDGGNGIRVPLSDDMDFMDEVLGADPLSTIQESATAGQSGDAPSQLDLPELVVNMTAGAPDALNCMIDVDIPKGAVKGTAFICETCLRPFKTKAALNGHQWTHKEAKS